MNSQILNPSLRFTHFLPLITLLIFTSLLLWTNNAQAGEDGRYSSKDCAIKTYFPDNAVCSKTFSPFPTMKPFPDIKPILFPTMKPFPTIPPVHTPQPIPSIKPTPAPSTAPSPAPKFKKWPDPKPMPTLKPISITSPKPFPGSKPTPQPSATPEPNDCFCIEVYIPVCGVDGKTYGNTCKADCAGVPIAHKGECKDTKPVTPKPTVKPHTWSHLTWLTNVSVSNNQLAVTRKPVTLTQSINLSITGPLDTKTHAAGRQQITGSGKLGQQQQINASALWVWPLW